MQLIGLSRLICKGKCLLGGQPKNPIKTFVATNLLYTFTLAICTGTFVSLLIKYAGNLLSISLYIGCCQNYSVLHTSFMYDRFKHIIDKSSLH